MSMKELTQLNCEAAVIGSVCVSPECFEVAERLLTVDCFLQAPARTAFAAMLKLRAQGQEIDPTVIANEVGEGGVDYIASAMLNTPTAANIELYCGGVLKNANRRKLGELADELNNGYLDGTSDPDEVLDEVKNRIEAIGSAHTQNYIDPDKAVGAFKDYFFEVRENPDTAFCGTGFRNLDSTLGGGLFRNNLVVVGARPGMGKTTLALNIAENIASAGKSVLFISLEMSAVQIMAKRIAIKTMLDYSRLLTARLNDINTKIAMTAAEKLATKPFFLCDNTAMNTVDILRTARSVKDLRAVVVDYLGLIKPFEASQNKPRYEQMTEISAQLKAIARTLNVPVIVLAQLNRQNVSRAEQRPQLTDLRDSGAIEQDADVVILLHRKEYYEVTKDDHEPPEIEEIELIVAKSRHGEPGVVKLAWNGASGKVAEYDIRHGEPIQTDTPPIIAEIDDDKEGLPF